MIKDFDDNTPAEVASNKEIQEYIENFRRRKTEIFLPVLLLFNSVL